MEFKKIKTVQDAFAATGRDYSKRPDVTHLLESESEQEQEDGRTILAGYDLRVVVEAINMQDGKRWLPDFRPDNSEYKYNPYFWIEGNDEHPSGAGFSHSDCGTWLTHSLCGSRLCFRDRERWKYCTTQFVSLWEGEFIIQK